jgi:hypothetical protein
MIKRLENWLRLIFRSEVAPFQTELAAIESRLGAEINKRLAVIEAGLAQQLDSLTAQAVATFAANVAEAQRELEHKILETQNLLTHCKASEDQVKADHQLRHPRHKR